MFDNTQLDHKSLFDFFFAYNFNDLNILKGLFCGYSYYFFKFILVNYVHTCKERGL